MPRNFSRLVIALGAALLAGAPALHAQQSGAPVRGDVDGDGRVTAADARIVSDFLVGKPIPAGANVRERGDVNGDGRITSVDAAIIARAAAGRDMSRFPVGTPAADIPGLLATLTCRADLRAGTVNCGDSGQAANPDGPRALRFAGDSNGVYVKFTTTNIGVTKVPGSPGDTTFAFDVAFQNRIPQSIGTTDNVNPDIDSVRVFFTKPPTPNGVGDTGNMTPDGPTGLFTATGQHYYQFPGFLAPGATTPATRRFRFVVHGLVTTFDFKVAIAAAVQYPAGWVDIYRPDIPHHAPSPYLTYADTMLVGEVDSLKSVVRNPIGDSVTASPPVGWGSNNDPVATVGSGTGVVTANAVGNALLTASSTPQRSGHFSIVVTTTSIDSTTITAANPAPTAGDSTLVTVQVKDQFGRNVGVGSPYVPAVALTTNLGTLRGTAAAAATVTPVDVGDGTYTAWLKSDSVGAATVTGTLGGVAIVDNAVVTFGAGTMTHFRVEAAAGGNIPDQLAGASFNVKVTARDVHDNIATAFTGTVGFTTPTAPPGGGVTAGSAGPSAAFSAGVLSSHAITINVAGDYTLAATRTGGSETGTSNAFQVQAAPTAVADGPTANSVPGDPYHTAFNTTYNLPAATGLMANDTRGFPLATVTFFGGGDLGGLVTGHAAGSTVAPLPGHADGSLTVNADGSVAFTPYTGFTGLYTFQYRIANVRGTSDAQVTIAVGVRPAANNDSYPTNLLGNVPINTATSSNFKVSTNDVGDAKVLALGTATNGTALLNADGTFTFTPNAGYTGAASFTYTVTNGFGTTAPATVSMTVSGIAWFIDKGAAAGDGRFGTPFNDLSTAFAAATKPLANQPIFLYSSGTSYTGGVTLLAGQRLVGQGATGGSFAAVMGVTWPADAGTQPSIGGTNPTVGNLALGNGNTLQGFNVGGAGTLSGTGFGTLTVSEVGISTTGQALNLTTGTISGGFTGVTSSGGTNNVALSGVTFSGAVGLGSGTLSGATGSALSVTNGTSAGASDVLSYSGSITNATAAAANATVAVSGGSTRLTLTGNVTQTNAGAAVSVSGGHTGVLTFNTGTVSATNGTGLQFDNADGSYDFGSSPNLSLNGGDAGIDVQNGSGGTFTFASSAVITNPTAEAIRINASSPTFTYPGRITKTNGSAGITVTSNSGGTISFGSRLKTITSTGANVAVNLATNGTATITSLDSLVIASGSGAGFNATGGGTVSVQGANNSVNSTGGGTAVNVSSTTIAGTGLTFKSVSATGSGATGIVLSSTGSGPFTVTGDGNSDPNNTTRGRTTAKEGGGTLTLGSGGSISGRSGNGVTLATTGAVTLRNMTITGSGTSGDGINASSTGRLTLDNTRITGAANDHGLWGSSVSGLAIHHSEIDNNATTAGVVEGPDIWNVRLLGLTGTDSIRNSNIHHSQEDVLGIINTSGTLNLTVLNTNITDTGTGAGGTTAFMVSANGSSNVTLNVQNDSINRGRARGLQTSTETAASAVLNLTVNNSQFLQNGLAIENAHGSSGTNTFSITNNNLQAGSGSLQTININRLGSPSFNAFGLFTGTISGNTIGTIGVSGSGSDTSNGIDVESNGSGGITRVAIVSNTIRETGLHGISVAEVDANTGGTTPPLLEARVASNTISNLKATALDGINVLPGALNTDDLTMCIDIANNNSTGIRNGLRVRPSGLPAAPSTVQLEGWDGVTAVNTYFTNRPNTLAGGTAAISTTAPPSPGGFVAVANCNTP